jgi:hypothetical protein
MAEDKLFPRGKPSEPDAINRAFDQYKLAVEMWDHVRARRQISNSFYLTINTAILSATGFVRPGFPFHYLSAVGIIICILWIASILNYRSLTDEKYDVIRRLETLFPSAPFSAEMIGVKRPFTLVERGVPLAFILLHILFLGTN